MGINRVGVFCWCINYENDILIFQYYWSKSFFINMYDRGNKSSTATVSTRIPKTSYKARLYTWLSKLTASAIIKLYLFSSKILPIHVIAIPLWTIYINYSQVL